jgi:hypothetical protein
MAACFIPALSIRRPARCKYCASDRTHLLFYGILGRGVPNGRYRHHERPCRLAWRAGHAGTGRQAARPQEASRVLQLVLDAIWLLDAVLQYQPALRASPTRP